MKRGILLVSITIVAPLVLSSAEPSAFGAGNLNNPEPYGLTSSEKVILQNKHELNKVVVKSNNQANEVDSLRERIDGLQGIIETLSRQAHNNKIDLKKIEDHNSENVHNSDEYQRRLSEVVQSNSQSIEKTDKLISETSTLVQAIEKDYVTKAEYNSLVNDVNKFKDLIAKELKSGSSSKATENPNASPDLYNQAKDDYDKQMYTKSIENYETLIKRNYKPAYSHYMIGDMNFKRKNYAEAITYFKKSSSLYDKASYMPTLMLHTAISMEETGDKGHADAFYKAVVSKYPTSDEAKEAKKYLGL
jgi:TolA-binding protein